MTVYPPVSVFLGDCGECQLELDGGELAEGWSAKPIACDATARERQ